jgi:hypothetical protein
MKVTAKRTTLMIWQLIPLTCLLSVTTAQSHEPPKWLAEALAIMHDEKPISQEMRRLQDLEACEVDAARNEAGNVDRGTQCTCEDTTQGVRLVCVDQCNYCNAELSSCGVRSAQALYDESGIRIAIGGVFVYTKGCVEGDILAVTESGCTPGTACTECQVFVNDEQCNSCRLEQCPDSTTIREIIDCTNIEDNATFNFCDTVVVDDGVFEAFNNGEFSECLASDALTTNTATTTTTTTTEGKGKKKSKGKKNGKGGEGGEDCPSSKSTKGKKKTGKKSSTSSTDGITDTSEKSEKGGKKAGKKEKGKKSLKTSQRLLR